MDGHGVCLFKSFFDAVKRHNFTDDLHVNKQFESFLIKKRQNRLGVFCLNHVDSGVFLLIKIFSFSIV